MAEAAAKLTRGELTREKILATAETVFAQKSFDAARLEDVAQEVGIRRASIVYYFKNKQELYQAVESRVFSDLEEEVQRRLSSTTTIAEKLLAIADAWLDFMIGRPLMPRLILRKIADVYPGSSEPVRFSKNIVKIWETTIEQGQQLGEIRQANPSQLMLLAGSGILTFATAAGLFSRNDNKHVIEQTNLAGFRKELHTLIYIFILERQPE